MSNKIEPFISKDKILNTVFDSMPYVFWKNRQGVYLGANQNQATNFGYPSPDSFVGKNIFQIFDDYNSAKKIDDADNKIMDNKLTVLAEEKIVTNNTVKYFLSQKLPLLDEKNHVIGMIGFSMDITNIKIEEERTKQELKIAEEKEKQSLITAIEANARADQQQKFVNIANQVAHDIRSPLSSLLMIVKSCAEIPEQYRIALREAAISIGDIANNLLNTYKNPTDHENSDENERSSDVLVSALLMEVLTEKKYQYHDLNIKFDFDFTNNSYFAFIKIKPSSLRRAISNVINNAVDAFNEKSDNKIVIKLQADNEFIKITVEDHGKGMSPEVVKKILANVSVTSGKKGGHGIGLTQVRETLSAHQGEMDIISVQNLGTQMILTFPRIKSPTWIADEIRLNPDDIVVILDDDTSIHGAWNTHFDTVLAKYPKMKIHHFDLAKNALHFLKAINENDKKRVFLLTDFELLKQEMTGLHVVEKSKVVRSILVTSHYANKEVLENAAKTNTKILPKQLASEIPIIVDQITTQTITKTDVVLVDDNKTFTEDLKMFVFRKLKVDVYHHPQIFLDNVQLYDIHTKIYLDCNFVGTSMRGTDVAEILHKKGFLDIYLLSGERLSKDDIPTYVKVILKDHVDAISNSL